MYAWYFKKQNQTHTYLSANYLDNWKCFAVLKGDGSNAQTAGSDAQSRYQVAAVSGATNNGQQQTTSQAAGGASTARYLKLGNITSANQVPWH